MDNTLKKRPYQRCTRCVMDTTDSQIEFDEHGVCDHCRNFDKNIKPYWHPDIERMDELMEWAEKIKKAGKGKPYDCLLGLSGGVDSCYLAHVAKNVMGLRVLAFVVDTGWNLNLADENIEKIVSALDMDIHKEVINWEEMKDFQLAMFKSQISSQDAPQDHAIFASMYNFAVKNKIKYILTGSNQSTEFIRPPVEWIYMNDLRLYKDIQKKFGKKPLLTYPQCSIFKYRILYRYVYGLRRFYPLDYVHYDKLSAEALLTEKYGYTKYANKHYENIFTRFFEGYYLPKKFGFDTRKNVYSNQILAGTMSREEAIEKLSKPAYDPETMEEDKAYIANKLDITVDEFEKIIQGENKSPLDYKNSFGLIRMAVKLCKLLGIENRNIR